MEHATGGAASGSSRSNQVRVAVKKLLPLVLAAALPAAATDFETGVRQLLLTKCLGCHSDSNNLGGLSLETAEAARRGGAGGPSIVAGNPDRSPLLTRMLIPEGQTGTMPPAGPRASDREIAEVREWILGGAAWEGRLQVEQPKSGPPVDAAEMDLVRRIRSRIVANLPDGNAEEGPLQAYDEEVPGAGASIRMVPIPGGEFLMGTPTDETGRAPDEGPRRQVRLDAFWMAAHETRWDEFRGFMLRVADVYRDPDPLAAAVSSPTPPYVEMSFGMGITGFPAISMTQHAANKYAQWLSAKTGRFYRLPTEAEWEYACRAGNDTAYTFGDDPSELDGNGWYAENSDGQYRPVGTAKPNAWGLYDMHGNVWEWTLDQYRESYLLAEGALVSPWVQADRLYPRVVRGGSWMDDAAALRCGARRASDSSWKMQDPQLPKSIWYHTDAPWLGFRLVRPTQLPSAAAMYAYWNSASGKK